MKVKHFLQTTFGLKTINICKKISNVKLYGWGWVRDLIEGNLNCTSVLKYANKKINIVKLEKTDDGIVADIYIN